MRHANQLAQIMRGKIAHCSSGGIPAPSNGIPGYLSSGLIKFTTTQPSQFRFADAGQNSTTSQSDVDIRKTTRQYRVVGWRQCSFQSVTNYDADTPANVLVSTDMSALPAEVVVAKTSVEESSHQWRFVRQCHVDKVHEHILQSATKCDADKPQEFARHSMVLPFTLQGTRRVVRRISSSRKSSSKSSWWDSQQPTLHSLSSEVSQAKQRRSRFFLCGVSSWLWSKTSRSRASTEAQLEEFCVGCITADHSQLFLSTLRWISWERFQCFLLSPFRGTEQRVSRCTLESELMTLVKVHVRASLLNGVFTSYAAGQYPQISSVVMLTRLASEAN